MNKQLTFTIIFLLFNAFALQAQEFGGHPSSVKWKQINSENVRVIFPEGLDSNAMRIADVIEYIHANNTYSVGEKSKKLDVVLQTNQVQANGFVTTQPFRSEFFATGPQNFHQLGTTEWLDVLSIHEYRHALQFYNATRGTIKFYTIALGEAGLNLGIFFSLPDWYLEGDAILAETFLTESGRGRMPSFFKEIRANLLNGREYSYLTSRNGSLKKMLPNHYPLGYAISSYIRNEYGMDVLKNILADATSFKTVMNPFSGAMKKHTGMRSHEMYKLAYDDLKKDWEAELENLELIPTEKIVEKHKNTVTNYRYAQLLDDGSIVAIKSSFKEIPHLVHIKHNEEKRLTRYGLSQEPFLSENNGRLAWTEMQNDPRRANRTYTRIVSYDIASGDRRYVTSKSKYFSPHFSSKGDKIIVVKADENIQNKLMVIDAIDGQVLQEIPNPENDFLSLPKWTQDDRGIVYIAKRNAQVALMKYDLDKGSTQMLTDWTAHIIGVTDVVNESVYFSASLSGIDNIYTVSLNGDKLIRKLSSVKIGAYEPTVSKDGITIVMGEFTDMGYVLTKQKLEEEDFKKQAFSYVEPIDMKRFKVNTNPNEENILGKIPTGSYEVKAYKGIFNGLKLHSWNFLSLIGKNPQFNLSFQNILNNYQANIGAVYNRNEKTTNFVGDMKFGKWFTEIGLHAQYLKRQIDYFDPNKIITTESFNEANVGVSLTVPLNWTKGNYFFNIQPTVRYSFHQTSNYKNEQVARTDTDFSTVSSGFSIGAIRRTAIQNLQPRFGINTTVQYQVAIDNVQAERYIGKGILYLPGLAINHGIKIDANWQREITSNEYQFPDAFFYSRGYQAAPNDETFRIGFDYVLPLLYPDWGFMGLTYFKRVRANLFYDLGMIKLNGQSSDLNSSGVELIFDNKILNVLPLSLGLRQSFLFNTDELNPTRKSRFEVFFVMNM